MIENASTVATPNTRTHSLRLAVFRALDTTSDGNRCRRFVDIFLVSMITLSVLAVILESIASLEMKHRDVFYWLEVFIISVFSVEYFLRVWSCVESDNYSPKMGGSVAARLRFMLSPYALIDLIAILPFFLIMFGTFANIDMRFLRAVRLLRVLKLSRYSSAFDMLVVTCRENLRSLAAAFFILVTVMLLAASGIYYFERQAQPIDFGSIPAAMWWAFATLTTVGYGDVTPITTGGRIFGSLITVLGVGMVALPTGILASGYAQQTRIRSEKYQARASEALDDGILSNVEIEDLEKLRVKLAIGKQTASQILDAGKVKLALQQNSDIRFCPCCGAPATKTGN